MFIVWGKTIKRQKLGFVADYCAVCRDLRTFQVKRVGQASHVYYISFGEGELLGYERTCQSCNNAFETIPDNYRGMSQVNRPPEELITETQPNYYTAYKDQLEIDKKVKYNPSQLTPAERRTRLWGPFAITAQATQQQLRSTRLDWQVGLAFLALFPTVWACVAIEEWIRPEDQAEDARFFLAGLFISLGVVGWKIIGAGRRYALKHAVPPLAQSIAPLRPTEKELTEILAQLKMHDLKLGSKLKPADVLARVEQLRQIV